MRTVVFYPFPVNGIHGGTLRLRTVWTGAALLGPVVVLWWDGVDGQWRLLDGDIFAEGKPRVHSAAGVSALGQIKRRVFPSTLFESGRAAAASIPAKADELEIDSSDSVVLATSYLGPAVSALRARGASVIMDVHDLVWRAHRMDAIGAAPMVWGARAGYAATVRVREQRHFSHATALMACGWHEAEMLGRRYSVNWSPVGLDVPEVVAPRPGGDEVRVGLIGNFFHSATVDSARRLVQGGLGRDPGVRLVFGGIGSHQQGFDSERVDVLGPLESVDEFYSTVDCVVVPVANGTGMKCKLAEAVLAGRAVITTPAGACGYPPRLSKLFTVAPDPAAIPASDLKDAIRGGEATAGEARVRFADEIGLAAAGRRVAQSLEILNPS